MSRKIAFLAVALTLAVGCKKAAPPAQAAPAGTGAQTSYNRWGDYASMSVDPVDDCPFWFTTEYNNSGGWGWGTKIGSFKLPNCP